MLIDVDTRKVEKRELNETKAKIMVALDAKSEASDLQGMTSNFIADQTQKNFDLRAELFKKLSEIQTFMQQNMSKKVSIEELNEALSTKVDYNMLRNHLETKANMNEIENVRRAVDLLQKQLDIKASFKDVEIHSNFVKNVIEDINKELLLKASIKDLCTLLDQKANVEDINTTLLHVQKEVEKCVAEDELRKVLND